MDKWKRATDDSNRFKNFGFCTFATPYGARRAAKLLSGFKVDYQEILIRVGKKEQEILDKMDFTQEIEKDDVSE